MKLSFTLFFVFLFSMAQSQLLTWSPQFITEQSKNVMLTADATKGNMGLLGHTANDVYVHIGVITNYSTSINDWKHVLTTWTTTDPKFKATPAGTNKWSYTITDSIRRFFDLQNPAEKILKIAVLFHAGDAKIANSDGTDMYVPVYDSVGLHTRITQPYRQPMFVPTLEPVNYAAGDVITISAVSNSTATLQLSFNGTVINTVTDSVITSTANVVSGNNQIISKATSGSMTTYDTVNLFVNTPVVTKDLPAGVRDGINYGSDGTSVTLVMYAPYKTRVSVIGDFNNWVQTADYQMFRTPDNNRYWITITGLEKGKEYAYQYLVDGKMKVADIYAEKILDPFNDAYISAETYPSLKPYPAGQLGLVSVLQTAKPEYNWQVNNFTRPDKRNLLIYELLVRDFVEKHNWQTLKDSLPYLKNLGINAIEVMPFNEFEGNSSWGYNPDFFFAPDKYYGTDVALKQFIDECHKQGIAVIMDMVMNHAFGSSPTVQLYWDTVNNRPAANSPWHNPIPKHPVNVGYDFNHESPATQQLVNRVVEHWLTDYKIDGFRWDLSKGFTQTNSGNNYDLWANYDAGRIATWKRIYDTMQNVVPGSYCILEHFADNTEEKELSNYGMLLWGNLNYNYNQATMGYSDGYDFSYGIYTNRGWENPFLVTYMESHDEERLMYKNEQYGNSSGTYNIKEIPTGLERNEMATAFWAMQPAPKMLWQFGELGYDFSINRCEDGTINNDCRLSPKPIRWDYKNDSNRMALYNIYKRMFALRTYPEYMPAFVAPQDSVTYSLNGDFKWEKINSAPIDIAVIGNFGVTAKTGSITFSHAGTWYDYLEGSSFTVTNTLQNYTLQPGEYHVFLDQNAGLVLPLQLLSFNGNRATDAINLNWTTANEKNVNTFTVQRSFNGKDFEEIGVVAAANGSQNNYQFGDKDLVAVNNAGYVYYKLKMNDKDGFASYSAIVRIDPVSGRQTVIVYPNPVRNGIAYIKTNTSFAGKVQVRITDASGRVCSLQTVQANGASNLTFNVAALTNGLYNVTINNGGKEAEMHKLMIQR